MQMLFAGLRRGSNALLVLVAGAAGAGRRGLLAAVRAAHEPLLVGRAVGGERRLRVRLRVHAPAAVHQLQAQVSRPPPSPRVRIQGVQHVHRRPLRVYRPHAHYSSVLHTALNALILSLVRHRNTEFM